MKGIGFALEHLSHLLSASGGPPADRLRRPSAINCGGGRRPNTFAFRPPPPVEHRRGRKPQPVLPPLHRISTSPSPFTSLALPSFDSSASAPALPHRRRRPKSSQATLSLARCIAVTSRSRRRTAGRGATCPKLEKRQVNIRLRPLQRATTKR